MSKICSDCNQEIVPGEKVATGSDGDVHYRCFKQGTAQGRAITLASLDRDLGLLKRRVQELEQRLTDDERSIDFRVG